MVLNLEIMRLHEVFGISSYDLKTWGVISIMLLLLIILEVIFYAFYHQRSLEAHILMMGLIFFCFYNQGFLAGIAVTRCAIKEERESAC